jgi:heat shock protein HslJ
MAEIELAGTSWVVTSLDDAPVPDIDPPTIAFDDERVSGSTGANRFTGGWTLANGVVVFTPLATTRMAGPAERMELERRYLAVLEGRCTVYAHGDGLMLRSDGGSLELRARNPDGT